MAISGDQRLLKKINRMALIRLLRERPGLSRADLAIGSGLTKSTVSLLVQELIDEHWLREDEVLVTGSIGRRPTPLRLDGRLLTLIGAEIELGRLNVVGVGLDGLIVERLGETFDIDAPPAAVLVQLVELIARMAQRLGDAGRRAAGVGIAVPGALQESDGQLLVAPNLGWRKLPMRPLLHEAFARYGLGGMPFFVQNDCDAAALGEIEFSSGAVPDPLVFIGLGVGVGAGVVVDGRLLRGQRGFAGEVGHIQLQPDGPPCRCGRHGCAEAYIGVQAVADGCGLTVRDLFAQARGGEPAAVRAVQAAGQRLGVLMHNLWTTLDPALIVLGGSGCELGPAFLNAASRSFEAFAQSAGIELPELRLARHGADAVPVGAAALVLHKLTQPLQARAQPG
ncbi:MAG: ROK family transcriptional regulator [Candidatus Dactylopiibacterium sp.]|nr:ROK family transcriptional regulator [Candidatus Dactylopiibacterium sp.]